MVHSTDIVKEQFPAVSCLEVRHGTTLQKLSIEKFTYASFFKQLYTDRRCILVKINTVAVKDIYIIPLGSSESIPECILKCGAKQLPKNHPDLLLAAIISCKTVQCNALMSAYTSVEQTSPSRDPRLRRLELKNTQANKEAGNTDTSTNSYVDKIKEDIVAALSSLPNADHISDIVHKYLNDINAGDLSTAMNSLAQLTNGLNDSAQTPDILAIDLDVEKANEVRTNEVASSETAIKKSDCVIDVSLSESCNDVSNSAKPVNDFSDDASAIDSMSMDLSNDLTSSSSRWESFKIKALDNMDIDFRRM
ncbi:hypothetical protein GJ496_005775 [Pomphorhynchus laevis]|nr:hypothetical protein GJ496_005775 [Pomphorhynchus laevis]